MIRANAKVRLLFIAVAILTVSYTFSTVLRAPSKVPQASSPESSTELESSTPHLNKQLIQEADMKSTKAAEDEENSFWRNSWISSWSSSSSSKADTLSSSASEPVVVQRENATFVTLCRNSDMWQIINSIKRVEDRFNHKFKYDWVFLNEEEFSADFKDLTSSLISGEAKYGVIPKEHWSYPEFIDQERAKTEREEMRKSGIIYAESESYRHMCRFNSGFFFLHPLMKDYKYYWRVEPDINFFCDIDYDLFKYMRVNDKTYAFVISIYEFEKTIATLWKTTVDFIKAKPEVLAPNNMMDFISDTNGETYNLCHFWSNFEIADMDFWRSQAYTDYFNHLDRTGGFFYERWGDAPVHSIAAALFLPRDKVHFFEDLGYNHGVYSMCPLSKELRMEKKCYCDPKSDFTFRGYSCGKRYYDTMNITKPTGWENYT